MDETMQRQVLASYFATHGVVRHQIESFDFFADVMLSHIITENSDVKILALGRNRVEKRPVSSLMGESRDRSMTLKTVL